MRVKGKDKVDSPQPMDVTAHEVAVPEAVTNESRVCYAVETLVAEFRALFPETPVEYIEVNGRNTALGVVFDLTTLDADTARIDAGQLLRLLGDEAYNDDPRIATVVVDNDTETAAVVMHNNPRTQDSREPFGLADAWSVLTGASEPDAEAEDEADLIWDGGDAVDAGSDVVDGGSL